MGVDALHKHEEWARQEEIRAIKVDLVAKLGTGKLTTQAIMDAKSANGETFLNMDPVGAESMINYQ